MIYLRFFSKWVEQLDRPIAQRYSCHLTCCHQIQKKKKNNWVAMLELWLHEVECCHSIGKSMCGFTLHTVCMYHQDSL